MFPVRLKNIVKFVATIGMTIAMVFGYISLLNAQQAPAKVMVYKADLKTVNETLPGNKAKGTAEVKVTGDEVTITVNAEGLPPNTMVMQHIHGFKDGKKAACATMKDDTNKDKIVDAREAEKVTGAELIPLNDKAEGLDMMDKSYPKTSAEGTLQYSKKISLKKLQDSMEKKNKISTLQMENMVVNLHGVSKDTKLPPTVKSVMKLPANATVPVACGELKKAQ